MVTAQIWAESPQGYAYVQAAYNPGGTNTVFGQQSYLASNPAGVYSSATTTAVVAVSQNTTYTFGAYMWTGNGTGTAGDIYEASASVVCF
jgi:hypothetical protein